MITQSGLGKDRDPWALRKFLAETGRSMADVARAVNTPRHKVTGTVRGVENHRRTLAHLLALGCPPEALFPLLYRDPETHRATAERLFDELREAGAPESALRIPVRPAHRRAA